MGSLRTGFFATFALMLFGTGLKAWDLPEEWVDVSSRLGKANPARGCLTCSSGGFQYSISRNDAIAIVMPRPGKIVANISKLHIGPDPNDPDCQGQGTPKNAPTSHEALVSYEKCGIVRQLIGDKLTFSANVTVTLRVPTNNPTIFKTPKFRLPLTCVTYVGQALPVPHQSVEHIQPIVGVEGGFDVDVNAYTISEIKPLEGWAEAQVVTVNLTIDQRYRNDYLLFVDSCWMGFSEDKDAEPKIPYINRHGCEETEGFDVIVPKPNLPDYEAGYEFLISSFEGQENQTKVWFHFELNTCYRNSTAAELTMCQRRDCPIRNGGKTQADSSVGDGKVNFYLRQGTTVSLPPVVTFKDGVFKPLAAPQS